jgi:hypothetical protein
VLKNKFSGGILRLYFFNKLIKEKYSKGLFEFDSSNFMYLYLLSFFFWIYKIREEIAFWDRLI